MAAGTQTFNSARLDALLVAIPLTILLFSFVSDSWTNYWLLTDGQTGTAIIVKQLRSGHNSVAYRYTVNHKEYRGEGRRNLTPPYNSMPVEGHSVVYYSASHPWLSALNRPATMIEGLPPILLMLLFDGFAIVTLINPKSKWAIGDGRNQPPPASAETPS